MNAKARTPGFIDGLRREIELLSGVTATRRSKGVASHGKTALAALLFEAQRLHAHRSWNARSLQEYAAKLGIKAAVLNKYKQAGRVFHDGWSDLYEALMAAVEWNDDFPLLPAFKELDARASTGKLLAPGGIDALDLPEEGVSVHRRKTLMKEASYGRSTEDQKSVLHRIDRTLRGMEALETVLKNLPAQGPLPEEQWRSRRRALQERCVSLHNTADSIGGGGVEQRKPPGG